MKYRPALIIFIAAFTSFPLIAQPWQADNGDGTYRNPIIHADYSDPDVVRAGEDFYMVSSSFNCVPGLPVLHSTDLVNWKIVNHVIKRMPPEELFSLPQHGNGVWAPSLRYYDGTYYVFFGDPDHGIYMSSTEDPEGEWAPLTLMHEAKGWIDPCPLWDDDGKAYLVHAFAFLVSFSFAAKGDRFTTMHMIHPCPRSHIVPLGILAPVPLDTVRTGNCAGVSCCGTMSWRWRHDTTEQTDRTPG